MASTRVWRGLPCVGRRSGPRAAVRGMTMALPGLAARHCFDGADNRRAAGSMSGDLAVVVAVLGLHVGAVFERHIHAFGCAAEEYLDLLHDASDVEEVDAHI